VTATGSDGQEVAITCPTGKIAIGGGARTSNANNHLQYDEPDADSGSAHGWKARVEKAQGNSTGTTTVHVICAPGV
jgi:hypothetical protein